MKLSNGRAIRTYQLKGMTNHLCHLANVSKSGYYKWLSNENLRRESERQDEQDFQLINDVFLKQNGKAGAKTIRMILENEQGVIMNLKKIRRLMKKYGLVAKVRQANPYKKMAQATQKHGHLKDEAEIKSCQSIEELKSLINEYMLNYNISRYQWTLEKMTPNQYRDHLLAA